MARAATVKPEASCARCPESVFDVGVRGHFAAALCASPILGGAQELGADALAAVMSLYKPTFHITYGPDSSQPSAQDRRPASRNPTRAPSCSSATKIISGSTRCAMPWRSVINSVVFLGRRFGPEECKQMRQCGPIGRSCSPDVRIGRGIPGASTKRTAYRRDEGNWTRMLRRSPACRNFVDEQAKDLK